MAYNTRDLTVKINGDTSGLDKAFGTTSNSAAKMGAVIGAVSGVVSNVLNKAIDGITASVGDAVKRVDTLNTFPKVLGAMGVSADDAKSATDKLSISLRGLPTALQDGAAGVQQFVAAGLSSSKATDTFLAMNDALLAAGGNAQDTGIVMDSLTRAISGGSTQVTTIQAALSRMPTALQGLQKATGKSADELYKLYAANPKQLADDLIDLDKKGGGGLSSLSDQAREATAGIGTGITNAHQAVTRGIANIIQAVGSKNISSALSNLGGFFESLLKSIALMIPVIEDLGKKVGDYLGPKFSALGDTLNKDVLPVLKELWEKVIKPLIPVIGELLVKAIGLAVDALNKSIKGVKGFIKEIQNGNPYILGLIGVFGTLAAVMAFNAIFNAITVGFATFRLVTIPRVIASFNTIAASSAGVAVKMIANFVKMSVSAVVQAVKTTAAWVASAASATAAWIVDTVPKIIAAFSLTAIKSYVHAADTALAWIINAARVSFVWVTQEMPKLVTSFVVTAFQASVNAIATSAVWTASASKTSFAWVVQELPKIIASFVITTSSAIVQAAISSAAWVTSAVTSSTAWVVQALPKIILAFVLASGSAIAQAAIATTAWVAAAFTSSASYAAFAALVATPLVLPAIAVAAAIASLVLVADAVRGIIDAIGAMNNAASARANLNKVNDQLRESAKQAYAAGDKTKGDKLTAAANIKGPANPSWMDQFLTGSLGKFANGGFTGQGGVGEVAGVVHKGEYVLPQSQVNQSTGQPKMMGSNVTLNVNVGMYAGMPVEKRQIALELYKELVRAARSQGVQMPMIGAIGAQ